VRRALFISRIALSPQDMFTERGVTSALSTGAASSAEQALLGETRQSRFHCPLLDDLDTCVILI
jgi:hypothetical protein